MLLRTSLISLIAFGLGAQAPAPAPAKPKAASKVPAKSGAKAAATAPAPKPAVLARVDGVALTEADFQSAFALLPQQEQMQILMVQGGKEEFVKRMAESKLLAAKARRMGLEKSAEFQRALTRAKDDLLAREYLVKEGDALKERLGVTDAEVKAYYDAHADRFKQPDLVSVRHILVSLKQDPKAEAGLTDEEAKVKIAKIQEELKAGAKFEDLAKTYSDDPGSKDNGGLYADADPAAWVPEFGNAARTQPIGEVGAPVKTTFGYHLVKVESRKPSRQVPFEEAKQAAEQAARRDRQVAVWGELMASLEKEIPFELTHPSPAVKKSPKPAPAAKPAAAPKDGAQ